MQAKHHLTPIWIIICFSFLLTTIPYFAGYLLERDELVFNGFVVDVEDGNAYLSKMMSGAAGDWLHTSKYSTLPQSGLLIHLPYLWFGKLAGGRAIHDQLIALFHLYRFIALSVYCFGLFAFFRQFLGQKKNILIGIVLAIWGGGLGWIFILPGLNQMVKYVPLEFYTPESFSLMGVIAFPHIVMARGIMLFGIAIYLEQRIFQSKTVPVWVSGFCILLSGLFQPLNAAIGLLLVLICEVYFVWKNWSLICERFVWKQVQSSLIYLSSPIIGGGFWLLYMLWISTSDRYYIAWSKQNQFFTPGIVEMLAAYGLIGIYIIANFRKMRIAINKLIVIPFLWILIVPVIIYLPMELQRRFMEGVWVGWVVLGLYVFELAVSRVSMRFSKMVFSVSCISSIILIAILFLGVTQKNQPQFIEKRIRSAYAFLAEGDFRGNMLAPYQYGNQIPAWTKLTSVAGLKPETIDLDIVLSDIDEFYNSGTRSETRLEIIDSYNVDFVFFDMNEAHNFIIDKSDMLCAKEIYNQDQLMVMDTRRCHH